MPLPTSFFSQTIGDNTVKSNGSPEITTYEVPITTLTAGNVTAKEVLIANLLAAVDAIILGQDQKTTIVWDRGIVGSTPAASQLAQRENKWLCRYHGNTLHQKFQVSIGTADLTQLPNHSEFLDLTGGVGAALKTAFEAIVVSPDDDSEAVTLDSVQFVGRNT
jgi:hypothetical protein